MAGAVSWVPAETWNVVEFRLRSRQLAQLMRNDFSSIKAELAKAFPRTESIQERYVPFVWRYAHELSGMYSMAVLRNFVNRASANTDPFIKLKDVYQRSDVDRFLHNVHRKLLVQNTIIVTARPIPRRSQQGAAVRVRAVAGGRDARRCDGRWRPDRGQDGAPAGAD